MFVSQKHSPICLNFWPISITKKFKAQNIILWIILIQIYEEIRVLDLIAKRVARIFRFKVVFVSAATAVLKDFAFFGFRIEKVSWHQSSAVSGFGRKWTNFGRFFRFRFFNAVGVAIFSTRKVVSVSRATSPHEGSAVGRFFVEIESRDFASAMADVVV